MISGKFNMVVEHLADIPLRFGVTAGMTEACKELAPTANVILHQADVGEREDDIW